MQRESDGLTVGRCGEWTKKSYFYEKAGTTYHQPNKKIKKVANRRCAKSIPSSVCDQIREMVNGRKRAVSLHSFFSCPHSFIILLFCSHIKFMWPISFLFLLLGGAQLLCPSWFLTPSFLLSFFLHAFSLSDFAIIYHKRLCYLICRLLEESSSEGVCEERRDKKKSVIVGLH